MRFLPWVICSVYKTSELYRSACLVYLQILLVGLFIWSIFWIEAIDVITIVLQYSGLFVSQLLTSDKICKIRHQVQTYTEIINAFFSYPIVLWLYFPNYILTVSCFLASSFSSLSITLVKWIYQEGM